MAQAPNRGLEFIVEDRNNVFGTLNNGDTFRYQYQAYIMDNLRYDSNNNKIVRRG
jgi:hypothetical protein